MKNSSVRLSRSLESKLDKRQAMRFLSDKALDRLRGPVDLAILEGTRYTILDRVARGGMGVVYEALDEKLGRRVALKVLDASATSGELTRRLIREAQVLARLEHPGIVPVHDVGTLQNGSVYYAMKYVEGQRLDKHVEDVRAIPDRLRLFLRICDTVAFAHARGVLHRDLKPANIMVGPFGEVLVLDWGLAKILHQPAGETAASENGADASPAKNIASTANGRHSAEPSAGTGQGTVLGTPGYMSPEQERGEIGLDERSDIFSLGAVLRFLSIEAATMETRVTIDKSLQAICTKAIAAAPENRYLTVAELAADVSRYLDGHPVTARKETLFDRAVRFYRRYEIAILLIAVYLLVRIVLLLISRR
jgi:eukaryotic-like serine/threonine-protein kinase